MAGCLRNARSRRLAARLLVSLSFSGCFVADSSNKSHMKSVPRLGQKPAGLESSSGLLVKSSFGRGAWYQIRGDRHLAANDANYTKWALQESFEAPIWCNSRHLRLNVCPPESQRNLSEEQRRRGRSVLPESGKSPQGNSRIAERSGSRFQRESKAKARHSQSWRLRRIFLMVLKYRTTGGRKGSGLEATFRLIIATAFNG